LHHQDKNISTRSNGVLPTLLRGTCRYSQLPTENLKVHRRRQPFQKIARQIIIRHKGRTARAG
jgi:hypothetical protein